MVALNIALVDDEKEYLAEMEKLCRDYRIKKGCRMDIFSFHDGESFLDALADTEFSIVFMDIYMGEMDGIAAARRLREKNQACVLIFLTTSGEFMPEAFSCHAFEYISKPIDQRRVEKALDDAMKILPTPQKFIEVACNRKTVRIFLQDIISATTDAHYLELSLADGSCLRCRMTVTEFLRLTGQDSRFVLANRGVLLNAGHVLSFGNGCCIMDNGAKLPLRIKDTGRVEQAVMDYNFEMIRRRQNTAHGRDVL